MFHEGQHFTRWATLDDDAALDEGQHLTMRATLDDGQHWTKGNT